MVNKKHKVRIKVSPRVLIFNEGKDSKVDTPDEIIEGEETILDYDPGTGRYRNEREQHSNKEEVRDAYNHGRMRFSRKKYDRGQRNPV